MTPPERAASSKIESEALNGVQSANFYSPDEHIHNLQCAISNKKRKVDHSMKRYIKTSFILGSTGEIGRVWSIAKYILPDNRKSIEALLLEDLLFLKASSTYWDMKCLKEQDLKKIF